MHEMAKIAAENAEAGEEKHSVSRGVAAKMAAAAYQRGRQRKYGGNERNEKAGAIWRSAAVRGWRS